MAITSAATRKAGPYTCNGVTVVFPFSYKVFVATDVLVILTDAVGVESTLTTGYTVTINVNQDANPGGTVTMTTPPPTGSFLTLGSQIAYTQPMVLTNNGGFFPTVLNDSADRCVALLQQVRETITRTLTLPFSINGSVSAQLPTPVGSGFLGWNAAGDAIINYAGVAASAVSAAMAPIVNAASAALARVALGAAASGANTDITSITGNVVGGTISTPLVNGGQIAGFRNKIVNGDMRVSQVNGSAAVTIPGYTINYVIDQFYAYSSGGATYAQRIAGSGSDQFRHLLAGAAGVTSLGVGQRMESSNVAHLVGNTAIFGVDISNSLLTNVTWVAYYANTADAFGTLAAPTRTQFATGTFTVTGTLARYFTPAITIPAGGANGIEIVISVGAQTSGSFIHGNWQLEQVSATATQGTAFERASYADQLRWCQRFLPCWLSQNTLSPVGGFCGFVSSPTLIYGTLTLPVPARGSLSGIVVSNAAHLVFSNQNVGGTTTGVTLVYTSPSGVGISLNTTASALVAGQSGWLNFNNAAGYLYLTGAQL